MRNVFSWVPSVSFTEVPKFLFFLILILYPFFSIVVYKATGMEPNYVFAFICLAFLVYRLLSIYRTDANFHMPYYVVMFAIFSMYATYSNSFVSVELQEEGAIKYLYSNPFLHTFLALLIVENTVFPKDWLRFAVKVLGVTLVFAAIVSVIQIYDPPFLTKMENMVKGISYDRISEYYVENPNLGAGNIDRFLEGYRLSIYSYINDIAIGIDSVAVFSILIALKSFKRIRKAFFTIVVAFISFLSSSRWIMLNFLIVASQGLWIGKNRIFKALTYGVYFVALSATLITVLSFSGMDVQSFVEERLLSNSASTRLLAFDIFSKVYPDSPILGTGGIDTPEMLRLIKGRTSQIHVGYLKLFYYYGLVGGILYLVFLATLLFRMWKMARISEYWGAFFAILAFCVANLTLFELDLFYHGLLLAVIFSNHISSQGHLDDASHPNEHRDGVSGSKRHPPINSGTNPKTNLRETEFYV